MQRSIFLACLALAACAAGGVADPFYVHVNPSLRTAYHSRARIVEDRPMLMTLTRAGFDTKNVGDFGKIGFWNWTVSSLTDRRATRHRHALNEMDYGVFWTYVWDFGRLDDTWRGWGLTTDVMKDWLTFEGYSHPARLAKTNASISEWRLAQSLDNPYLTPFYLVRRGLHPHDWLYVQTGVRRVFALTDALSLTPPVLRGMRKRKPLRTPLRRQARRALPLRPHGAQPLPRTRLARLGRGDALRGRPPVRHRARRRPRPRQGQSCAERPP